MVQKVFNRWLYVCAAGLDILKTDKTPLIYSIWYISSGGWSFVWGDNRTKVPHGNETVSRAAEGALEIAHEICD